MGSAGPPVSPCLILEFGCFLRSSLSIAAEIVEAIRLAVEANREWAGSDSTADR